MSRNTDVNIEFLPNEWEDEKKPSSLAETYRDFRLLALRLAPDAFASTYEHEVQFPEKIWVERLRNADVVHIVATKRRSRPGRVSQNEEEGTWIGLIVVHRREIEVAQSPNPWESYNRARKTVHPSQSEPLSEIISGSSGVDTGTKISYHLNGMFVHPSARGCGIGADLIHVALGYIRKMAVVQGLPGAQVKILVDSSNIPARKLYERCGFKTISEDDFQVGGLTRIAFTMVCNLEAQNSDQTT